MLLEPLTDALALVHDRIKSFEREFTTNEQRTRLSLVDPVLKALGWDPQDPSLVKVEFSVRQRNRNAKADYALLDSKQKPIAFVEAKRLGTDLGLAQDQLFEYGAGESVPYAIATDGTDWAVYKRERQGNDLLFKQLLKVSVRNHPPTLAAVKLLALWRGLLTSYSSIDHIAPALDTLKVKPKPDNSDESFNLSNPITISHRKPTVLLLPDGTTRRINNWSSLLEMIVKWLRSVNRLDVAIPWKANSGSSRNTLQRSEFQNKVGMRTTGQVQIAKDLFLLTNYDARTICNIAAKLLTDCRVPSSEVKITLAPRKP